MNAWLSIPSTNTDSLSLRLLSLLPDSVNSEERASVSPLYTLFDTEQISLPPAPKKSILISCLRFFSVFFSSLSIISDLAFAALSSIVVL